MFDTGLLPPVKDGDRILVDGGLLNTLRGRHGRRRRRAGDLRRPPAGVHPLVGDHSTGPAPGRRPPARPLGGTDEQLPSIQDTLIRSIDLAASARPLSDLPRLAAVIEPDATRGGSREFSGQINQAVEADGSPPGRPCSVTPSSSAERQPRVLGRPRGPSAPAAGPRPRT